MAIALNKKYLCSKAWSSMNPDYKIKNIFDLLESNESYDRVVGEYTQLFAKYASKLSDDVAANQVEISEDQKKKLSTFLDQNPMNSNENESDSVRNDIVDKQSVQLTPKQEN